MVSSTLPAASSSSMKPDGLTSLRRSPLALGIIGLVCGFGLTAASVTLVRAADDAGVFETIRNEALSRLARSVRLPRRDHYASETAAPARRPDRGSASRKTASAKPVKKIARVSFAAANNRVWLRRTMCVRTCDGFTFPVGTLASMRDLPAHRDACASACPGAPTALYTLAPGQRFDDLARARSVADGAPYGRLRTAFLYQRERVASCSCQGPDNIAQSIPILSDPTLRTGDLFVDPRGEARVFAGPVQVPHAPRAFADYRASKTLTRTARAQVDRLMGTSQREAAARAFERRLRTASNMPFREVAAPAGSAPNVRVYQVSTNIGEAQPSGARIIVIR